MKNNIAVLCNGGYARYVYEPQIDSQKGYINTGVHNLPYVMDDTKGEMSRNELLDYGSMMFI